MPQRVLETVLTARNLLSPELARASRDVVAFNSVVARANAEASAGAASSAGVQQSAAAKVAASNVKASTSASASAEQQMRAHTRAAESASLSARVQETANRSLAASNGLLGTSLTPLTAGLGAVALGMGYAAYKGMDFDKSMSAVQAATQASAGTMGQLRDAAMEAGAKTQYSAVEAAQGITEMSKAGVSARDIMGGGLAGALNLAAAGQMEVAEAAEVGATALSVFGLKGDQMSHVADLLAAGAGKAQGSVHDMAAALNQSALVANQAGLSIEDTAGALALFAHNGLIGSDAGTSFKAMLQALTPNSKQAAEAMDAVGFSAFDARGNFVGLEGVAGQLKSGLAGLTEQQRNTTLETIFGSDAVRAASVLYKEGAKGVAEWAAKTNDAGFASRVAAQLMDNLGGDLNNLSSAAETVFIALGEGAQGPLRLVIQTLTHLVNVGGDVLGFINDLPGPVKAAMAALAGFHLLGGPVANTAKGISFAFDVMRASAVNAGGAMGVLKGAGGGLLSMFGGPWGLAITGVIGSFALLSSASDDNSAATFAVARATERATSAQQSYKQALEATNGVIDESVRRSAAKALQDDGLLDLADKLGISTQSMTDSVLGNKDAYAQILPLLEEYQTQLAIQAAFNGGDRSAVDKAHALEALIGHYKELVDTQPDVVASERQIAAATGETGAAMGVTAAQTEAAAKAQEEWLKTVQGVLEGYVDPLATYKGLLDEKAAADRDQAEKQAAATKSSSDSWKDFTT
ncbi:MAG: phage tail tape measure protein, partial [Friedmanniella sp.]|nr:phage tail tape measure protein [Friedmanniella sp.]